jgi:hypothetical protein
MSIKKAQFPSQIWDGQTTDRVDGTAGTPPARDVNPRLIDANPSHADYDQVVAEMIATQQYVTGLVGGLTDPFQAEAGDTVAKGMPVYLDLSGHLQKSQNNMVGTYQVVGLMLDDALAGFTGAYISDGQIEQPDWTAVTGSPTLTKGAVYFLDEFAGQMTTAAPTDAGQYVLRVGRAQTETIFDIEIAQPIRL